MKRLFLSLVLTNPLLPSFKPEIKILKMEERYYLKVGARYYQYGYSKYEDAVEKKKYLEERFLEGFDIQSVNDKTEISIIY